MEKEYYYIVGDHREGPFSLEQLRDKGLEPSTMVWTAGMADWTRADAVPELEPLLAYRTVISDDSESAFGGYARPEEPSRAYGPQNYNIGSGMNGAPSYSSGNWKTLAIVATVCGFLFSCVGGIVGIFGIVAASNAGNAEAMGDYVTAKAKWSSCKTLTIISFVLSAIGLIVNIVMIASMAKAGLDGSSLI